MPDFLLELGFEEIPARMIANAQAELARRVTELLVRERLLPRENSSSVTSYSTPRRLAIVARGIAARQQDTEELLTGPAAKIAFKDGQPTPAAHAFARKAGVDVLALHTTATAKGEYVTAKVTKVGSSAGELLGRLLPAEISALYWPKAMYWRRSKPERMVRPLRWMVALLDSEVVPLEYAGVAAGNQGFGHRVLHGSATVRISSPQNYSAEMKHAFVECDPEARRHTIRKALDAQTRSVTGARWREDEALVETVVHLTEWPSVVLGNFGPEHLQLPEEVLVTVMRDHQKYFAVEDAQGKLAPHFLAVLNTQVDEEGAAIIRHGHARVLQARFNDARFFWDTDQKISLEDRVAMLSAVTFHKQLGSYADKTTANCALAGELCSTTGPGVNAAVVGAASALAKADLTAELVKEFTELQGIIGGLYAEAQGQPKAVADAIYDQYQMPRSIEAAIVGLADRANTIVDMFAIGLAPTGSRDPFALRRAANGIIRILAEHALPLTLSQIAALAIQLSKQPRASERSADIEQFFRERLTFHLREALALDYDVVNAVLAAGADDIRDVIARGQAVAAVRATEDFSAIAGAFKRTKNILAQAASRADVPAEKISASLLADEPERELYAQLMQLAPRVEAYRRQGNYAAALDAIATLRPPLDIFFDKVMVMATDAALRGNRLALLTRLLADFSSIADFSEIVVERA